jgi:hypothetical protein
MRVVTSTFPPAANGATILIGFVGHSCAATGMAKRTASAATIHRIL